MSEPMSRGSSEPIAPGVADREVEKRPSETPRWRELLVPIALALALGLVGQGARGLFEPDEGRSVEIALAMLASGDWLVPRLHGLPYLDKPPLAY
ncbi:MAG TPA: hypothetical protein VI942_07220, partial [Thermoanaerobaculia bacterium]|nr:hypothetical protein [Thermoanaerobaculia bacterium]